VRNFTSRQKSLYLAAKLYELAAEFTDDELQTMLQEHFRQSASSAIQAAIQALMQLHKESETVEQPSANASPPGAQVADAANRARSPQTAYLADLFDDRTAFPTVADIADALRIEAKPKEARERYIARASRMVDAMDVQAKATFFAELRSRLNTRPNNFISKWSKLIKEM
jgi:Arc/MetJ-type ribon-helix-helix transcriptional regulator